MSSVESRVLEKKGKKSCSPWLSVSRYVAFREISIFLTTTSFTGSGMGGGGRTEALPRKRVAVVGAGAAGMAAAWSLSRFPDKYDVTVIEAGPVPGGVACTFKLPDGTPVNYGVQGGSPPSHQNTIEMMRLHGVEVASTRLDVSFGKGQFNWKNYSTSELQQRLQPETARFGRVLWWLSKLEFITIFLSIDFVLRVLLFSADFRQRMVYPLVALFFGTGNQTPQVSSAVVARVFLDPNLAIFQYDSERLLSQTPTNIAFDDLEAYYGNMAKAMAAGEGVRFRFGTKVAAVERSDSAASGSSAAVRIHVEPTSPAWRGGGDQQGGVYPVQGDGPRCQPEHAAEQAATNAAKAAEGGSGASEEILQFDELILACPADAALRLLGEGGASFWERRVLSSVTYYNDLTVTHTDEEYMRAHNDGIDDKRAIYYIRTLEERPECLEMGFDLTAYQPQLVSRRQQAETEARKKAGTERIFQTIFLDQARSHLWSIDKLNPAKVLDRAWWSAFSHTYEHFRWVVPWVWTVQGHKHTWYAGSWTLFNTHDIAISSGLAAAERLGAPYPFTHNEMATATYDTVLAASHLRFRWMLSGKAAQVKEAAKTPPGKAECY